MTTYDWSNKKNEKLKGEREISFERAVQAIEEGNILAEMVNPSPNHNSQNIFILNINNYAYVVPFYKKLN